MNKKTIACPRCGKPDTWTPDNVFRPFCSERCKLTDLGDWAAEKHRLPGERVDENQQPNNHEEEK